MACPRSHREDFGVRSVLTPKTVFLVGVMYFQGEAHCIAGFIIRNFLCHLDFLIMIGLKICCTLYLLIWGKTILR